MIKKALRYLLRWAPSLDGDIRPGPGNGLHESVYFYTFHRCASALFAGYLLQNIEGLRHVDYARQIYRGNRVDELTFKEHGFVYGPIRLSANRISPTYKQLVGPTSDIGFIQDRIAIFLVRDPRDILVSTYYSFGYSHGFSPVDEVRARQEELRNKIRGMSIDEYALEYARERLVNFETLDKLSKACRRSVVLKYEDMIGNWDCFVRDLTKYVEIKRTVLTQLYKKSRPREKENELSHRRSGKPGSFRNKLKAETIASLDATFKTVLERYRYDA
jgi:hypothetical protein